MQAQVAESQDICSLYVMWFYSTVVNWISEWWTIPEWMQNSHRPGCSQWQHKLGRHWLTISLPLCDSLQSVHVTSSTWTNVTIVRTENTTRPWELPAYPSYCRADQRCTDISNQVQAQQRSSALLLSSGYCALYKRFLNNTKKRPSYMYTQENNLLVGRLWWLLCEEVRWFFTFFLTGEKNFVPFMLH